MRELKQITEQMQKNRNTEEQKTLRTHTLHKYRFSPIWGFAVMFLILLGAENKLFAQGDRISSSNYSFFEAESLKQSDKSDSQKEYSFLSTFNSWPRRKKMIAFNTAAVTATMVIGAASWDYYSSSFRFKNEGWLDPDTDYGGADKFGHAFGGYALTSVYNTIYKDFGYSDKQAIAYGALSSWALLTLVEVGDGFSKDYGFSIQDEAFNTAGVGLSYLRHRYPALADIFDYRLEWVPSKVFRSGDADPFTDYEGQKYLVALKPDGILKTDNSLLKAIELDFGFYTRGYDVHGGNPRRYIFYGVGLNVTYIIEQLTGHRLGGFFNYIQMPFTYIPFRSRLD
ncbi:MAG: DUF2279 domain-containing protein [Sedimentisphaerales bacterium]